ncbi:MAG: hypothetical protein IPI34_04690 [bacterium]|nr:hypothetical protein [bacterium]
MAVFAALALPAVGAALDPPASTDLNGDGAIDFCDYQVFAGDFISNNLRSDFSGDGVVNLTDTALLAAVYCTGPAKTAVAGTATIGVYFDPAGTISQLVNIPAPSVVDLYVVAHGVTEVGGLGGYTFDMDENSSAVLLSEIRPAGFLGFVGHDSAQAMCVMGGIEVCMGPASAIVLDHYTLLYMGDDTTIDLRGVNHCSAPSALPSYVSCGDAGTPCDWTYFDYEKPNGRALIVHIVGGETANWSEIKARYR